MVKPECLECHDTPADAPKAMLNSYGPTNGFGWKAGEINCRADRFRSHGGADRDRRQSLFDPRDLPRPHLRLTLHRH